MSPLLLVLLCSLRQANRHTFSSQKLGTRICKSSEIVTSESLADKPDVVLLRSSAMVEYVMWELDMTYDTFFSHNEDDVMRSVCFAWPADTNDLRTEISAKCRRVPYVWPLSIYFSFRHAFPLYFGIVSLQNRAAARLRDTLKESRCSFQ